MAGNYIGNGCSGHTRRAHMSAYDGMPPLLRRAMREAWEDWCTVSVLDRFMDFRAQAMDPAAAARATALHFAEIEEHLARRRAKLANASRSPVSTALAVRP